MGTIIRLVRSIGAIVRVGVIVLLLRIRRVEMDGGVSGWSRIGEGCGEFLLACRDILCLFT